MKNLIKAVTVGIGVVAASVVLAQPALAVNFIRDIGDGTVRYTDDTNQMCLQADNTFGTAWVEVAVSRQGGGGTPIVIRDDNVGHPGATCRVLNVPENVTYQAVYRSYWEGRGTPIRGVFYFTT
ncbi:hypothetical protein [Nonomuraea turcica]|uniref:hypothetical protein n=1 Tax=Nonomuraea sp. G32 TaxID=3067274 RepID=UPI00273CD418|nr:hypothetical protein [Nonomuraea sp. G32]MDP4509255.1 hypothetical protein [Nonomuraea sp. G32]